MHGFEVKNLKLSTDPNSATSNQRVYDIMSTFQNNLTLTTDKLIVNNNLDFGATYLPKSSKVPTVNDDLTNKNYVDNKIIGNNNFNDNTINGSRLINSSVSSSKIAANSIDTSKIVDAHISTEKLVDLAVTNAKINSVDYSKITNVPASFPSKTSTLTVDSDITLGVNYITTTNASFANASQVINKGYVDNQIANITFPTTPISLPIGSIVMWAKRSLPNNWLECFVRGLDNGKGYDSGRQLGSYQADTFQSHTHTMLSTGSHNHLTSQAAD